MRPTYGPVTAGQVRRCDENLYGRKELDRALKSKFPNDIALFRQRASEFSASIILTFQDQFRCILRNPLVKYSLIENGIESVKPQTFLFADDGKFPNSKFPLLLYRQAVELQEDDPAALLEQRFARHDWTNSWRNGVYSFVHYHSTTAEVLGVYRGWAELSFGGIRGETFQVSAGDVIVIPAGVPHQKVTASPDFGVVGAYPEGRDWDVLHGLSGERPQADRDIADLPIPMNDPIYGDNGPLVRLWKSYDGSGGVRNRALDLQANQSGYPA